MERHGRRSSRRISVLGAGVLAIVAAVVPATPAAASGGLDPSFGTNGTAAIKITEWQISAGILLPGWNGGTILVGGTSKILGGYRDDVETLEAGALASVTSNGAPDTTFNYGEVRAIDPEAGFVMDPGTHVVGAAVDPRDGLPLVATEHLTRPGRITKLTRTSVRDWSVEASAVESLVVLADGRVRYCGSRPSTSGTASFVGGLTADGKPDTAVGPKGERPLPAIFGFCEAMALTPSGALVLASNAGGHRQRIVVARTNLSGVVDTTFGKGGVQVIGSVNRDYQVSKLVVAPDGGIFMLGQFRDYDANGGGGEARVALHKLSADGKGLPGFGSGGQIRYGVGYFVPGALTTAPGGKVVLSICNGGSGSAKGIIYRVLGATGSPDSSFGAGGKVIPPGPVFDARITSSGKLLTVGVKAKSPGKDEIVLQRRYG